MNNRINDRFFNEAFRTLFKDGKIRNLSSTGFSSSKDKFKFSIPPNEYFKLTDEFDVNGKEFSHFTTLRGLFSILNSESIRLYNLDNLNDPTEYSYALNDEFKLQLERKKSGIYILSTCMYDEMTDAEKLDMWQNYGEKGLGARLILEFEEGVKYDKNSNFLKRVQYKKYDLTKFIEAKQKIEKEENIPPIEFLDTIKTPCILHKNSEYEMEKEVRLVYLNEYNDDESLVSWANPQTPYFIEYSYTSKRLCKYYNLKLNDDQEFVKLRIKQIELGSKHKNDSQVTEILRRLCRAKFKRLQNTGIVISDFEIAEH